MTIQDKFSLSGKMNAFEQLNLARKLTAGLSMADGMVRPENRSKDRTILAVLLLGQLSDKDSESVINMCLQCVLKKDSTGALVKIVAPSGHLMFSDISLQDITDLVTWVIDENLGDFLHTALLS